MEIINLYTHSLGDKDYHEKICSNEDYADEFGDFKKDFLKVGPLTLAIQHFFFTNIVSKKEEFQCVAGSFPYLNVSGRGIGWHAILIPKEKTSKEIILSAIRVLIENWFKTDKDGSKVYRDIIHLPFKSNLNPIDAETEEKFMKELVNFLWDNEEDKIDQIMIHYFSYILTALQTWPRNNYRKGRYVIRYKPSNEVNLIPIFPYCILFVDISKILNRKIITLPKKYEENKMKRKYDFIFSDIGKLENLKNDFEPKNVDFYHGKTQLKKILKELHPLYKKAFDNNNNSLKSKNELVVYLNELIESIAEIPINNLSEEISERLPISVEPINDYYLNDIRISDTAKELKESFSDYLKLFERKNIKKGIRKYK